MNKQDKRLFLIKIAYWLGIAADGLWSVALLSPPVFGILTGDPDFSPDLLLRRMMGIAGILMTGWTFLLLWAVKEPVERRFVILLTAFPVVFGLFIVALVGVMEGNILEIWILIKSLILFVSMVTSYVLSGRVSKATDKGTDWIDPPTSSPAATPLISHDVKGADA